MKLERFFQKILDVSNHLLVHRFGLSTVSVAWQLNQRCVAQHYLIGIARDNMWVEVEGKGQCLGPGSFVYVAPGVPHTFRPVQEEPPPTIFHLRFTLGDEPDEIMNNTTSIRSALRMDDPALLHIFEALFLEYRPRQAVDAILDLRFKSLLVSLLAPILQQSKSEKNEQQSGLSELQQSDLKNYCTENLHRQIIPAELAARLKYNPAYFTRQFKQSFGISPRSWIMRLRIRHAALMLEETTLSISEIAMMTGCQDIFRFSKQFKQIFGVSPRTFRNQALESY